MRFLTRKPVAYYATHAIHFAAYYSIYYKYLSYLYLPTYIRTTRWILYHHMYIDIYIKLYSIEISSNITFTIYLTITHVRFIVSVIYIYSIEYRVTRGDSSIFFRVFLPTADNEGIPRLCTHARSRPCVRIYI